MAEERRIFGVEIMWPRLAWIRARMDRLTLRNGRRNFYYVRHTKVTVLEVAG